MIRVLVLIAVTGFLVSVVSLSTAIGIAGPETLFGGLHSWGPHGHWFFEHERFGDDDGGPKGARDLAWTGGDSLEVDVPAQIAYTQGPGPAKLTVTGSQAALDALVLEDGRLRFKDGHRFWSHHMEGDQLDITMTAPNVSHFALHGANGLTIADYHQDALSLRLSGDSEVSVKGEAKSVDLQVSGSADTDLSQLKVQDAAVDISGSGDATLAPTASASLNISGSGEVTLLTNPPKLATEISGSGHVRQTDRSGPDAAPAPPAPPAAKPGRT